MRLKRTRQATKQHQGTVYVDLDSDEFEEVLAGDQVAAARPLKRCKVSSSSGALQEHVQQQEQEVSAAAATEAEEPAAAAAAADLLHVADEQGTESAHEEEELELVECSEDPACDDYSDSNRFNDSGICSSSCSEFECSEPEEEAAAAYPKAGKQQQQQQLPSKQKEKKPRKKRQSTRRLCASYAKAQFRLTDADLKKLKDVKCEPNPHYPGGYPMKLYLVRELEELARAKQESKARLAGDKEERAAARALEARARKVAAAAAAAQTAQLFGSRGPREERHGSLQLPDTCLASIMAHLAGSMQPGGLRGPSCVAGELAQASLVCWDFYHAAHQGFQALAQATDSLQQHPPPQCLESKLLHGLAALPGPAALGGWAFWDSVVQQPASLKLKQLKDAARQLGVMVTGTKAELMLRLLGGFGLAAPSRAPARLLRALQLERSTQYDAWDGPEAASLRMSISACCLYSEELSPQRKIAEAKDLKGVAGMRAAMSVAGYSSPDDFLAAAKAAAEKRRREEAAKHAAVRAAAEAARSQAREAARLQRQQQQGRQPGQVQRGPVHGIVCACGNAAAAACPRGCCGSCCKRAGGCQRHKVGFHCL